MSTPFPDLQTFHLPIKCDHATLGFEFEECDEWKRVYLKSITPRTTASGLKHWRTKHVGPYIVQIDSVPIFTVEEAERAVTECISNANKSPRPQLEIVLAPDRHTMDTKFRDTPLVHMDQLRNSIRTLYEIDEGHSIPAEDMPTDDEIVMALKGTQVMEQKSRMTRKHLMNSSQSAQWKQAEYKMLDKMAKNGMYAPPPWLLDSPTLLFYDKFGTML